MDDVVENAVKQTTWAKWNPEMLKTKRSSELTTPMPQKNKKTISH